MTDRVSRIRVLVGALAVQVCLGAIYGWGVFVPTLKASRGELAVTLSANRLGVEPDSHAELVAEYQRLKGTLAEASAKARPAAQQALDQFLATDVLDRLVVDDAVWKREDYAFSGTEAQAVFSTGLLTFALVMVMAGRWQDRAGPRLVGATGVGVLAVGYALAGLAGPSFLGVLLAIGVVGGAGIGLGYVCPIAACVKWFPDRKGPVTGLAVAGFGGGAFLFIKLAGAWGGWIATYGIANTWLIFAGIFATVGLGGALLLSNPPPGWHPAGASARRAPAHPGAHEPAYAGLGPSETWRTSDFRKLWLAFVCASGCGLMVIGSLKDFGVREGGLTPAQAESALSLLAVFNALGRIVWGTSSERLGPRRCLFAVSLLQAGMVLALGALGHREWTLELAACWVGFQFGGNLALFPLLTAERFGVVHLGANYGLVFTAYGIGGVLGPLLAGSLWDLTGSYQAAFVPAAAGCLIAAGLAWNLPSHHRTAPG